METSAKKTVKNILIRLNLKGYGIVNYDSGEQRWTLYHLGINRLKADHDNVSYAKKNFYKNEEGKTDCKIKISSDCLKHSIFEKEIPFQSPNISHEKAILYSFMGSPAYILRGGFHEFGKGTQAFKRKSPFQLNDAEQICGAISSIEMFSKSGKKRTDNSIDDKADNTLFKKETIGNIEYMTEGNIDLEQLQFVSTDVLFDRMAFNPDDFELFSKFLKTRLPNFNSKLGWYSMKNSVNEIPEYGFKFTQENILSLVKHLFQCISEFRIKRKSGAAYIDSFEYKLVFDPIEDKKYDEKGWVSVKSQADIDNIKFEVEDFYIERDEKDSKQLRQTIVDNEASQDKKSADKKQKQKEEAEDRKNKKKKKETANSESVEA